MAAAAATAANAGDEKGTDFYGVLGLEKEFTAQELRNAYKRLAMRWHPDRCSGSTRSVEEAKKKFQDIQEAYSVLSDSNKRFLYDVGVYQNDDDEDNDMGDFLSEMAEMMSQTNPSENGAESFEKLQEMFDEMFQDDIDWLNASQFDFNSSKSSSPSLFYNSIFNNNLGGNSLPGQNGNSDAFANSGSNPFNGQFQSFCFGPGGTSSVSSCNGEKIKRTSSMRKTRRSSQH